MGKHLGLEDMVNRRSAAAFHWLRDTSGTTAVAERGSNGTYQSATLNASKLVQDRAFTAASFSGSSGSRLEAPITVAATYPWTLWCVFKLNSTSLPNNTSWVLRSIADPASLHEIWGDLYNNGGTTGLRCVSQSGGTNRTTQSNWTLDTNVHFVCYVFPDASTHQIYLDGALRTINTTTGTANTPSITGSKTNYTAGIVYNSVNNYGNIPATFQASGAEASALTATEIADYWAMIRNG